MRFSLGDEATTGNTDPIPGVDIMTGGYAGTPDYIQPPPSYGVTPAGAPSQSSPSWFSQLVGGLTNVAGRYVQTYQTRNAVPQLNPGESITQLANGTYQITQQPAGVPATGGSLSVGTSANIGGISLPLLLLLGVGVWVITQRGR